MMAKLALNHNDVVGPWVASRVGGMVYQDGDPAIGVVLHGRLVAGVVFEEYNGVNCNVAMAAEPKTGWATRSVLAGLFDYPFNPRQLGLRRLTALIAESNDASLRLCTGLGFRFEARIAMAAHDASDVIVLRMFREHCQWIAHHGKEKSDAPGPA